MIPDKKVSAGKVDEKKPKGAVSANVKAALEKMQSKLMILLILLIYLIIICNFIKTNYKYYRNELFVS